MKKYETRSEAFIALPGVKRYRGPLAIHAAKLKFDPLDYDPRLCSQLAKDGLKSPEGLAYGAVLCVLDLVNIVETDQVREHLDARELLYGDYSTGRYALETTNLRRLDAPAGVKGHQGLFYWDVPSGLSANLSLLPCDGLFDPAAGKNIRCLNAGIKWHIQAGIAQTTCRFCNECYQVARKGRPGATFKYVGQEVAA